MLLEAEPSLHALLARCDVALMTAELLLLALWLVALLSAGPVYREAAGLLLWGPYAPAFLGFVVFGGLLVPATLGALVLLGKARDSRALPVLVLAGGLLLRFVVVAAGQATAFVQI
jgi:formate-dependent nitrite reductase membrane component NrfD